MRILVVTNMYPSEQHPADGIFVQREVEAIRTARPSWSIEIVHIDTVRRTSRYASGNLAVLGAFRRFSPDVIHVHYGLTLLAALCIPRRKSIVTFHGSDLAVGWQRMISVALGARCAERIIVSADMLDRVGQGAPPTVIPCGVDTRHFRLDSQPRPPRRLPDGREVVLGFPANPRRPEKGYDLFSAAEGVLRAAGIEVQVRTLVGVHPDDVPAWHRQCDCVVLTSEREGAPVAVREALCCGVRVVSTNVGDVAEWAPEFASGCRVVSSRLPEDVALSVLGVLSEPAPSVERAAAIFGIEHEIAALLASYERVGRGR